MLKKQPKIFIYILLVATIIAGSWSFLNLDISENIDSSIPGNEAFTRIKPLLDKGKKSVIFSMAVSPTENAPYQIEQKADSLLSTLTPQVGDLVSGFQYKSDIDPDTFSTFFYEHLYLFLDSSDYKTMAKEMESSTISKTMAANKATLLSPEGLALKEWVIKDPLHFMRLGYNKLQKDVLADAFIDNEGLFLSEDGKKLMVYATLKYNPSESKSNKELAEKLLQIKAEWNSAHPENELDYFGTFLIAHANATQIASDIKVTLTIAIIFILGLLFYYYRNAVILTFFLLPGVFGVLFAMVGLYFWQGHISGIALSAGAVVLGIVVDYSFHFFSHFKQNRNSYETRKQIFLPLLVSGTTTILAFFALAFAKSEVLHDFGLFTAFSLIGALVFVLAFLPVILKPFEQKIKFSAANQLDAWFDKIDLAPRKHSLAFVLFIAVVSGVFFYFASDVEFESDINKINFYPEELKQAEIAHQNINPDLEKRVHFIVEGAGKNNNASQNRELYSDLSSAREKFDIKQINSLGLFLLSEDAQQAKIDQWSAFWKQYGNSSISAIARSADSLGFKATAFNGFNEWVSAQPKTEDLYGFIGKSKTLSQLLLSSDEATGNEKALITSVVISKESYGHFVQEFKENPNGILVDGSSVMSMLAEAVKADFNYLLFFASGLVLIALLLIYGSIELTLVSFIPIALSWVWILGISSLLDFKFNFVNIIIVTFIFGLGDDFAIFITDGLQTKFKYGKKVLGHYKTGIVLSSTSTIIGTGVLIFAKHPAIKSIAGISVTGILTIVFISFFVQPILFHFFTTRRTNVKQPPVTMVSITISIVGYSIFILGSLMGVFLGFLIRLIPFKSTHWKKAALHKMLQVITGVMLDLLFTAKKRYRHLERLDFSKPSIIIANHASFFDILALARLNPNVVMMVNDWVYNSILFGNAIKYADYLPIIKDIDANVEKARELIQKGYSIVVFPEGKRSPDGKLNRFHKGAFYLADKLELDITPVILHGYAYVMPKYDYNMKDSYLTTYVLPRIKHDDTSFGVGYKERTKKISAYFKKSYAEVSLKLEAMDYQYIPLLTSYRYKGPVLEWYFRVKWRVEKQHYENYFQLIGKGKKRIYDLGCGYGFLSYFLKLRDDNFTVFGFDYDEDKVAVAQNAYIKREGIEFQSANITSIKPENADVIIIADTLHYVSEQEQIQVLKQCNDGLNTGGLLLIRDGLSDLGSGHAWTENSEKWSTKILKFNKTTGQLHFFSKTFIENWAQENNYSISFDLQSENSSNTLMMLRKK